MYWSGQRIKTSKYAAPEGVTTEKKTVPKNSSLKEINRIQRNWTEIDGIQHNSLYRINNEFNSSIFQKFKEFNKIQWNSTEFITPSAGPLFPGRPVYISSLLIQEANHWLIEFFTIDILFKKKNLNHNFEILYSLNISFVFIKCCSVLYLLIYLHFEMYSKTKTNNWLAIIIS